MAVEYFTFVPRGRFMNLSGQRFGELVAIAPLKRADNQKIIHWQCRCDCGRETIVFGGNLRRRHTTSCGCSRGFQQLTNAEILAYIEDRIERITESGCWIWTGSTRVGYGSANINNQAITAHRLAWTVFRGEIPDGMCVCHHCDVRACCNPSHLFLGDHADNARDRNSKMRQARGERHRNAKLNDDSAKQIYLDSRSKCAIAKAHNVSRRLVQLIKTGHAWRHVTSMLSAADAIARESVRARRR